MMLRFLATLALAGAPLPAFGQTLALDVPQSGSLEISDPRDRYNSPGDIWSFTAEPGIIYRVTLSSPVFDALLTVENGANRSLGWVSDDNPSVGSFDSSAQFATTTRTQVRIRAGSVERNAQGSYTIAIIANGACATATTGRDAWGCAPYVAPAKSEKQLAADREALIAKARASAAKGDGDSLLGLAMIEPDSAQKMAYLERAFTTGYWPALMPLVDALVQRGNSARAFQILNHGVDLGLTRAMQRMAGIYTSGGLGQPSDARRALQFYELAAMRPFGRAADDSAQGFNNLYAARESAQLLAKLYGAPDASIFDQRLKGLSPDERRALDEKKRLAGKAMDLNITANPSLTTKWLGIAARLGDRVAMMDYAARLQNGDGIARDRNESLRWFRKAAVADFGPAKDEVENLVARGEFK
ncbi:MAG: sel1 repeat family protein [Alphaproteobacteria bacterium]|nr:MAG: sel1 repeat family protein [Alphaproteobacteria bacterium]